MPTLHIPFVDSSPPLNPNVRENLLPPVAGIGNFDVHCEYYTRKGMKIRVTRMTARSLPNALANYGRQNPNHGRIVSVKRCK